MLPSRKYKEDDRYEKIGERFSCKIFTKEKIWRAVSEESRNEIFECVCSSPDQGKKVFVNNMIDCVTSQGKSRSLTMKYHLKVSGVKKVCKTFEYILNIKYSYVTMNLQFVHCCSRTNASVLNYKT